MKFSNLEKNKQSALIEALGRYIYPLFITTGVEGYDYHFIGTSFLIQKGTRRFFIFTRHQALIAEENGDFCIGYPQQKQKFIRINNTEVVKFKESDLAVFECDNDCPDELIALDSSILMPSSGDENLEHIVVGFPTEINVVDHNLKQINPKKIAVIAKNIDLKEGLQPIELDCSSYVLISNPQHMEKLKPFNQLMQGLSGAPVFEFIITKQNEIEGELDLRLIGVENHINQAEHKIYATRTNEVIACLHLGFSAYPELDEIQNKKP